MSQRQWIGAILVFIGLALDSKFGKEIKGQQKESKKF